MHRILMICTVLLKGCRHVLLHTVYLSKISHRSDSVCISVVSVMAHLWDTIEIFIICITVGQDLEFLLPGVRVGSP